MDLISEALADLDLFYEKEMDKEELRKSFHRFNVGRIKNRCYMAMLASPIIVQNFDDLIDELLALYNEEKDYCWETIRELSNPIIDRLREDIALSEGKIRYSGNR